MKLSSSGFSEALAKIGSIKEVISKKANSPLQILAVNIATQIISQMKTELRNSGIDSEGSLGSSIRPEFIESADKLRITIKANDYWDFVNSGVDGTKVAHGSPYSFKTPYPNRKMALSLKQGMATKGLSLPAGFKTFDAYAYAAAVKVKVEGIEPNHFVDNVLTREFIQEISLSLTRELGKEVILSIKNN